MPHIHRVMELGVGHQRLQHYAVTVLVNTPTGCAHYFRIDHASVDSLLDSSTANSTTPSTHLY